MLVTDQEVDYAISQTANKWQAGVMVVEGMLNRLAGTDPLSLTVGSLSETYGDRAQRLQGMLQNLRRQAQLRGIVPAAGGVLMVDRLAREDDTSLRPSYFTVGMDDNPPGMVDNTTTSPT